MSEVTTADVHPLCFTPSCVCPGISRSLESVLSGQRPRSHTVATARVDQQGRLVQPVMAAHSVVMQNDPRRFSEASIGPPPRPPPPNFKRPHAKSQRRPVVVLVPGTQWPPHMLVSAAPQPQIQPPIQVQPQVQPQPTMGGSNLAKMSQMARSTPQLDDSPDSRDRDRDRGRDKPHHLPNPRDGLIAQVTFHLLLLGTSFLSLSSRSLPPGDGSGARRDHRGGGHGPPAQRLEPSPGAAAAQGRALVGCLVTLFSVSWVFNQLCSIRPPQVEQLYSLSMCSRDECLRILSKYQWNLQLASRYLLRLCREDKAGPR